MTKIELGFGVSLTKFEDEDITAHILDNDLVGLRQQIGFRQKKKGGTTKNARSR